MRKSWGPWIVGGIALCCSTRVDRAHRHAAAARGRRRRHEEPAPPPPPPTPASIHVVHGSPDPGLSTFSIRLGEDPPIVSDLAAGLGERRDRGSVRHARMLHLLGVASVETGEATEVLATNITLAEGAHPIVLVYGEPSAEPPLTVTVLDEDASSTSTRARLVHGLVGVGAIDVCIGASPIATALAPGVISQSTPMTEGATAFALHAASDVACHGRALGVAHATLSPGIVVT